MTHIAYRERMLHVFCGSALHSRGIENTIGNPRHNSLSEHCNLYLTAIYYYMNILVTFIFWYALKMKND